MHRRDVLKTSLIAAAHALGAGAAHPLLANVESGKLAPPAKPVGERICLFTDHLDDFGADLVMGVGGSFDVISGFVPRAPTMLQRTGFEWAWRLACEPRRMWKRYAVTNAWVARQLVTRMVRRRRRRPDPSS